MPTPLSALRSRRLMPLGAILLAGVFALALSAQHPAPAAPAHPAAAQKGPGLYATFDTADGTFVVQLYPDKAPKTVANFVALATGKRAYKDPVTGTLATSHFYDGLLFFRTIPDYLIQTGDPLNTGQGTTGITIPDEKNDLRFDQPGRMSMAQAEGESGSRASQIFFTLKAVPELDKAGFLVFGQIVDGLDVAKAISEGPHHGPANDIPDHPVKIIRVTIQQK